MAGGVVVLPINVIGPDPTGGPGMFSRLPDDRSVYTKIEGEKPKPKPMIPPEVELSDEMRRKLSLYLRQEISSCEVEHKDFVDRMARYKGKYRTKFPTIPKDFPIPNSSQITIPIIKTNTDTLTARLFQTVMAADPMASVRTRDATDPNFQDFANDWELFLDTYSKEKLEHECVLDTALTECIKLGTSVIEVTRRSYSYKCIEFDSLSNSYIQVVKEGFNGPCWYNIPIEDFWIRAEWQDPQVAPWCGKELRPCWSEIKDMAFNGELDPERINDIWRLPLNPGNLPKTVVTDQKQEQLEPVDWRAYRIFELFVRWDMDGDGIDEELIVYYHFESNTILRCKFNTFSYRLGCRPFEVFRYKTIEYRFHGEGMCELLEHFQEEISTQHNQRLDNATIAALKIILTQKSIPGLKPGDPLWPGKIVRIGMEPGKAVQAFTLGEIYPSTRENEMLSQQYVRDVSGVGEAQLGGAQPVSRTTAAAQLSLLEETNRRYDKTLKGFRRTIGRIYNRTTDLFNQTGTGGLAERWFGQERGSRIEQMITMPADSLYQGIKVQIVSTKATVNREVELQTNIALMQLMIQNFQQLLGLVQQLAPQFIPMITHEFISSIKPVYKKVLQYSDSQDPDQAVKVLSLLESILPSPENMGGMGAPAGGPPTPYGGPGPAAGAGARQLPAGAAPATPGASRLEAIAGGIGSSNGRRA